MQRYYFFQDAAFNAHAGAVFADNFSNNNLLFHGFVIYLFVISNLNFDDILISIIGAWLLFRVHLRIGGNASI